jgi:hypothetical protein
MKKCLRLNYGGCGCIGLSLILLVMVALPPPIRAAEAGVVVTAFDDGFLVRGQHPGEGDVNASIAYNTVWDASTADYAYTSYSDDSAYQICSYQSGNLAFEFSRIALFFDISSTMTNRSIASATLSVCIKSSVSDVGPYNITIQGSNVLQNGLPVFPHDPLSLSDYSRFYYSGNYGSVNSTSFKTDHYTNITITDLSIIHPLTKMLLRLNVDIDGNHVGWIAGQSIGYKMYSSRSSYPPLLYLATTSNYTTTTLTSTTLQTSTSTASATSVSTSWSITTIPTLSTETTTWVTTTTPTTATVTQASTTLTKSTTTTAPATVTVTQASTTNVSNTTFSTSTTTAGGDSAPNIVAPLIWAVIVATCVTAFLAIHHSRQHEPKKKKG